ncbi:MAG: alkylmercury lyase family protein [Candidatus Kariarchaeaceae archaeon]|jgi:hypothetical protein
MSSITLGNLHHFILNYIVDNQYAPSVEFIASHFKTSIDVTIQKLNELAEYHGVVLHPNSTKIWVIHPFSLAPTNFTVSTEQKRWWGSCVWCSFGIAHLIDDNVVIETRLGANADSVRLDIKNKQLLQSDYVVHFPIKMQDAWKNVIYTCSVMLLFKNEGEVDDWCGQNNIPKGDIQPVSKVFEFAKVWYGNHLDPGWTKWTSKEAKNIFEKFNLTSKVWQIPTSDKRF